MEEAAAYLVQIRGVILKAYGRQTAVAGYKGRDSLADEGLEVLQRLFLDTEPVVVGMGVKEDRGDAEAPKVYDLMGLFFN